MKHIVERRDYLSLLLSHDFIVGKNIFDNAAQIPASELKSLFEKISAECNCKNNASVLSSFVDVQQDEIIYERPRKRARRSINNNLRSILRYVERILEDRYNKDRVDTNDKYARFLQNECECYFGVFKSFRAEEDILCLAFKLAHDAIRSVASIGIDDDDDSDGINLFQSKSDFNTIHHRDIIDASVRIIDRVVYVEKQEKCRQTQLPQSMMDCKSLPKQQGTNKRQKYAHLLQASKRRNKKETLLHSQETRSIIEKTYPNEWGWLMEFRSKYSSIDTNTDADALQMNIDGESHNDGSTQGKMSETSKSQSSQEFIILRRTYESIDDISLSSSESDEEMEDNVDEGADMGSLCQNKESNARTADETAIATEDSPENNTHDVSSSPMDELDKESRELRATLLGLPPGELSSVQVINHASDTLVTLLNRYSELSGTTGINRCGDVFERKPGDSSVNNDNFTLNEEIVTSVVKKYLTNATGALRAKALLEAFVCPLLQGMNPATTTNAKQQKPASRSLTSLVVSLARDRPMECVDAVLVPTIISPSTIRIGNFEPSRHQCELIARVLRAGRDSLSIQAIAHFVEKTLIEGGKGMIWTDNTISLLTTSLNRRPQLPEAVITRMAEKIIDVLSPGKCNQLEKSMKLATLFNALVTKYGQQLKAVNKVDALLEVVVQLKTFMSKSITTSLKKLK